MHASTIRIIESPAKNARIVEFVKSSGGSDYQEYLARFDEGFREAEVLRIFDVRYDLTLCQFAEETVAALLHFERLEWDTETLGFGVGRIAALLGKEAVDKKNLLDEVAVHARERGIKLIQCRVAYRDMTSIHALEAAGFSAVDAMNVCLWDKEASAVQIGESRALKAECDITVSPAVRGDEREREVLRELSQSAFTHSRLHNDSAFSKAQCDRFYGNFLEGILNNPSSVSLVAREKDVPVGVIAGVPDDMLAKRLPAGLGYVSLVAVSDRHRRRGIGGALLHSFVEEFSSRVRFVEASTQMDNYAALNLYARGGFEFVSSLVTFHKWLDSGGDATEKPHSVYRQKSKDSVREEYAAASELTEEHEKAKWGSRESMENRFRLGLSLVQWSKIKRWLDLGCGTGMFFSMAEEDGHRLENLLGIDITPEMLAFARKRTYQSPVDFVESCIEDMPEALGSFDLVTLVGVLQQCGVEPGKALGACVKRLRKGGQIFITTKHIGWRKFSEGSLTPEPEHSWFSHDEIAKILKNLGIRIVESGGFLPREGIKVPVVESHTMYFLGVKST